MATVRKVFLDGPTAGSETAYWEDEWAAVDLESARRRLVAGDPVVRLLAHYLPSSGAPVLEAGCGSGAVAAALGDLGHRVVGLDLAATALARARRVWPDFHGAVGDVRRMPFPDHTFGAVVSIGVLEHDESGPLPALREHRRVLRHDGLLLVTVPRISPLKSARDTWNLAVRRRDGYRSRGRWVVRRRRGRHRGGGPVVPPVRVRPEGLAPPGAPGRVRHRRQPPPPGGSRPGRPAAAGRPGGRPRRGRRGVGAGCVGPVPGDASPASARWPGGSGP